RVGSVSAIHIDQIATHAGNRNAVIGQFGVDDVDQRAETRDFDRIAVRYNVEGVRPGRADNRDRVRCTIAVGCAYYTRKVNVDERDSRANEAVDNDVVRATESVDVDGLYAVGIEHDAGDVAGQTQSLAIG